MQKTMQRRNKSFKEAEADAQNEDYFDEDIPESLGYVE